ncbi:MAG: hypothetical protein EOP34_08145, partial [Rickettsiales bacterium]
MQRFIYISLTMIYDMFTYLRGVLKMIVENLKEIVAVFESIKDMESAIDKLTSSGFNPAFISMLAEESKIVKKFGKNKTVQELMDDPEAPRVSYIANENIGAAQG